MAVQSFRLIVIWGCSKRRSFIIITIFIWILPNLYIFLQQLYAAPLELRWKGTAVSDREAHLQGVS